MKIHDIIGNAEYKNDTNHSLMRSSWTFAICA